MSKIFSLDSSDHTGKFLVWLWCKYVKKTKIGYKDIIFKYSGWLFWTVGVIFGIFVIISGYILLIVIGMQ